MQIFIIIKYNLTVPEIIIIIFIYEIWFVCTFFNFNNQQVSKTIFNHTCFQIFEYSNIFFIGFSFSKKLKEPVKGLFIINLISKVTVSPEKRRNGSNGPIDPEVH